MPPIHWRALLNAALVYPAAFLRSGHAPGLPVALDIILTKACNLRCVFCVSYDSLSGEKWMDFELYKRIAAALFPTAHSLFFCSGGEPLFYPRLREALRLAADHRVRVTMTSNGMLLDRDVAAWLVEDQSLRELCISFDGATARTLENIRRGADFARIVDNMAGLDARKKSAGRPFPRLWVRYVLLRENAGELPALFDLGRRLGWSRITLKPLHPAGDLTRDDGLQSDPRLLAEVLREARARSRETGIALDTGGLEDVVRPRRCLAPWEFCQFDVDGSIRFCYKGWRQRLGFFDQGFADIWRGEHYARIRRSIDSERPHFPYCRHCESGAHPGPAPQDEGLFLLPGLEAYQVPFNRRREESAEAFRQRPGRAEAAPDRPEDAP